MKFTLSLSKTITVDLDDSYPKLGHGWAEQVLEALRDDDPSAQIYTSDVDTLTGAIIRVVEADVQCCIDDLAIDATDFKVEVLSEKPDANP